MTEEEENNASQPPPKKKILGVPLVPDVDNWRRWWSMRWLMATAYFSAVVAAYMTLPPDWLPTLPVWVKQVHAFGALMSAGGAAVSRVIQQQAPK